MRLPVRRALLIATIASAVVLGCLWPSGILFDHLDPLGSLPYVLFWAGLVFVGMFFSLGIAYGPFTRRQGAIVDHQPAPPATLDDFMRADIRVGRVLSAEPLAGAHKPAYKLHDNFGPEVGVKGSSAQIATRYEAAALVGRLVLGVVNVPPRQIASFASETMTLGVPDREGEVVLLSVDPAFAADVPLGARMVWNARD